MSILKWIKGEEPNIIEKIIFMFTHDFDSGAYGEYLTEYMFNNENIEGYFKSLHNIYIPYKGKTSEIDVLLIHEKGLFVIESKNYSGWIFGSEDQYKWTQVLNKQNKNKFYNPIKQNETHIKALSQYIDTDRKQMISFIVFSERCELKNVPEDTEQYKILRRHHLLRELRKELNKRESVFTYEDIKDIYDSLKPLTEVTEKVKQEHIERIKAIK